MPRPYVFNAKFRRYAVWVKTGPYKQEMTALRSNRTAAGMTYTARRSELLRLYPRVPTEQSDISVMSLSVHGTTDSLMFGLTFRTKRLPCPCCGATNNGKLVLNERGRERLRSKRSQQRLIQRFNSAIYKGVTHMSGQSERRAGELWTPAEDDQLRRRFEFDFSLEHIMKAHGRSRSAILTRLIMLGLIVYVPASGWHRISSDPWVAYPSKEE